MLLAKGWPRRETWIAYNRGDLHMERSSFREAGYGGPSGLFVKICAKGNVLLAKGRARMIILKVFTRAGTSN